MIHFLRMTVILMTACLTASPATAVDSKPTRPNVLFIYLDDFGWRDTGFMGSDFYETPALDQLASESTVLTNGYACAANCAPSRACLLSGQYTPRHQIYNVGTRRRGKADHGKLMHLPGTDTLRPDIQTWAHRVQAAGYRTATIGKWHLSKDPLPYGFDVNVGGTHSGSPPKGYFPPHPSAPGLQDSPAGEYLTDRLHDEAIQFIEDNASGPWLLYLTHFAVHTPLQGKPDLVQQFKEKPVGSLHDSAVMAAMIKSVDQGVARLVATLDQLNLTDKTVIVFTADNGGYGPATSMAPLKGYKGTYYEGGIRVPWMVKWPGVIPAGKRNETPVTGVDIYPTLCAVTGATLPTDQPLDGVDLLPMLAGKSDLPERSLYWHFPAYLDSYARVDQQRDLLYRSRPVGLIRVGKWKLHQYFEDGDLELYDLEADVGETTNLAESKPKKAAELLSRLKRWQQDVGAVVPTERNPKYDAASEARAIEKIRQRQRRRSP